MMPIIMQGTCSFCGKPVEFGVSFTTRTRPPEMPIRMEGRYYCTKECLRGFRQRAREAERMRMPR